MFLNKLIGRNVFCKYLKESDNYVWFKGGKDTWLQQLINEYPDILSLHERFKRDVGPQSANVTKYIDYSDISVIYTDNISVNHGDQLPTQGYTTVRPDSSSNVDDDDHSIFSDPDIITISPALHQFSSYVEISMDDINVEKSTLSDILSTHHDVLVTGFTEPINEVDKTSTMMYVTDKLSTIPVQENFTKVLPEDHTKFLLENTTQFQPEYNTHLIREITTQSPPTDDTHPIQEDTNPLPEYTTHLLTEDTTYLLPEDNIESLPLVVILPEEAPQLLPEDTTYILPEETTQLLPEETTPLLPEKTTPLLPEDTIYLLPEDATYLLPEETTQLLSDNSTIMQDKFRTTVMGTSNHITVYMSSINSVADKFADIITATAVSRTNNTSEDDRSQKNDTTESLTALYETTFSEVSISTTAEKRTSVSTYQPIGIYFNVEEGVYKIM